MYIRKIAITLDFTINKLKLAIVPVKDTNNVFESRSQDFPGERAGDDFGDDSSSNVFMCLIGAS